jgi:small GTP-binding protein
MSEKAKKKPIIITILGDERVGKHSFLNNFTQLKNKENGNIGLEIINYNFVGKENEKSLNFSVEFRVIASQERNKLITKVVYEKTNGFIIIYDITNLESFNNINLWINNINNYNNEEEYFILYIGNKNDLVKTIKYNQIKDIRVKYDSFYEVDSLHESEKCKEIIYNFLKKVYYNFENKGIDHYQINKIESKNTTSENINVDEDKNLNCHCSRFCNLF